MIVVGLGGDRIGEVTKIDPGFLTVKEGDDFPTEHQVPIGAVARTEGHTVHLIVTKGDARDQKWPRGTSAGA